MLHFGYALTVNYRFDLMVVTDLSIFFRTFSKLEQHERGSAHAKSYHLSNETSIE